MLHSYFQQSATSLGFIEEKESVLLYHSGLSQVFFNVISSFKEPKNALNVLALLESAKVRELPFLWLLHDSNIHLLQHLRTEGLEPKGSMTGLYYDLKSINI